MSGIDDRPIEELGEEEKEINEVDGKEESDSEDMDDYYTDRPLMKDAYFMEFRHMVIDHISTVSDNVDKILTLVSDLTGRLEELEGERKRPAGCGFSCSNNSFAL